VGCNTDESTSSNSFEEYEKTALTEVQRVERRPTVYSRLDSGAVSQLALDRTFGDIDSFGRVTDVVSFPGFLVVGDVTLPPKIKVFDRASGELAHEFGRAGEGPGEFRSPRHLYRVSSEPPIVRIYDFQNQRLTSYDFSSGLRHPERIRTIPSEANLPMKELVPLEGTDQYLANGLIGDATLVRVDSMLRPISRLWMDPPFQPPEVRYGQSLVEANLRHLTASPADDRFAIAYQNSNRLDILYGAEGRFRTIVGPRNLDQSHSTAGGRFDRDDDHQKAYVDVVSTEDNIYALLCACSSAADGERGIDHLPYQVHVFDWSGDYRGEIQLDRNVLQIGVSADDERIWGMFENPVPRLGEWKLPSWVMEPG
jgi:hypothetical protein